MTPKYINLSIKKRDLTKNKKMQSAYFALPRILKTFVPQCGQEPFTALILFFITTSLPSLICTCFLHFMHRPSTMFDHPFPIYIYIVFLLRKSYLFYKCLDFTVEKSLKGLQICSASLFHLFHSKFVLKQLFLGQA
jgi:hypothetical protein